MSEPFEKPIVFTLTARCRDCYRCVRVCPVKAIRMQKGQAYVDQKRCIACGTCIRECPQKAKRFRHDIDIAQGLIENGNFVAASIAPSFAAVFNRWQRLRLASALRSLGFRYVGQTSRGAYQVSAHTAKISEKDEAMHSYIATACPAVVGYVEKYRPELVENLLPLVSPMAAHGKMLKERFGKEAKVVFIGPCVAKKLEITRPGIAGVIDCVLTFSELMLWFEQAGLNLATCEESNFDEKPLHVAQLYPLPGGSLKTAGMDDDGLKLESLRVDGIENLREVLRDAPLQSSYGLIEPLFCNQGCINGPGIDIEKNIFERRKDIIAYDAEVSEASALPPLENGDLFKAAFGKEEDLFHEVSEEEIRRILEWTGKYDPQQELNCGACGYDSCRKKAIAVAHGMAEPEMCIPFMRQLAESRTDHLFATTPNGIVILDEELNILHINPAFKKFFTCTDAVVGRHVSYLMDPAPFEKLISGVADKLDITVFHRSYNLLCRELLYILKQERQVVGIFVNITSQQEQEKKLQQIRSQTIEQANELLEHQIKMAQNIAQFLGESTAKGEELVRKLVSMSDSDEQSRPQ